MMRWGDLFAGGGGTTTGALMVEGVEVSWAVNHDPISIQTHEVNHPETKHYEEDIRLLNVEKLSKVDGIWASLECTNFSNAKGGKPREADSRTLGHELPRYITHCDPDYVWVENVREFMAWGPLDKKGKPKSRLKGLDYLKWVQSIKQLGYQYDYRILNCADYGAYTSRRRYFGCFARNGMPIVFPERTHDKDGTLGIPKWKACKDKIDLTNQGKSIFDRKKPLVYNSLRRFAGGILKYSDEVKFIASYYGSGLNASSINNPLPVITTKDRHILVQFIKQYYGRDNALSKLEDPLLAILGSNIHALVKVKRGEFLTDHTHCDYMDSLDKPMRTQTTRQTKTVVQFLSKYFGSDNGRQEHSAGLDNPYPTIATTRHTVLVSTQNSSNGKPEANNHSLESPLPSITSREKHQYLTAQYNSGNNPESQNSSIENPLNTITGSNHHQLVTAEFMNNNKHKFTKERKEFASLIIQLYLGPDKEVPEEAINVLCLMIDNVFVRFLSAEELSVITGFPEGYFTVGNTKSIIKMIGNAVPPLMAKALIGAVKTKFEERRAA